MPPDGFALEHRTDIIDLGIGDEKPICVSRLYRHDDLAVLVVLHGLMLEQMVVLASGCAAISARSLNKAVVCASVSVFLLVLVLGPPAVQRPDQERRLVLEEFFKELAEYRALSQAPPLVVKNTDWFPRSPYAQCALLDGPFLLETRKQSIPAPQPPLFPSKP